MPVYKILGQGATTSTGSTGTAIAYTNGTTGGVVAWALLHNRSTGSITVDLFVSTSTATPVTSQIYGYSIPSKDTLETGRFTMSTGDSVLWDQSATGISVSVFGSEGIST